MTTSWQPKNGQFPFFPKNYCLILQMLMPEAVATQLKAIAFPNLQQLTEGFRGRSQILKDIDPWLQRKDQRFFVLTGEPGVGKSAIVSLKF
jgi:hypothetical protein